MFGQQKDRLGGQQQTQTAEQQEAMRKATVARFFTGIEEEEQRRESAYFEPGHYVVQITEVKFVDSSKNPGKTYFVVETTVLDGSVDYATGQVRSWSLDVSNMSAKRDVQGFLLACSPGSEPSDITADVVDHVTSSANPLAGVQVRLEARAVKTKNGGDFTRHIWSAVE